MKIPLGSTTYMRLYGKLVKNLALTPKSMTGAMSRVLLDP
jgi:hypothetical protein